jgi:dTMP kinase
MPGRYIVFEGTEGAGKSTQAARLARRLDAVLTRESGGTAIGARLRAILNDAAVTDLDSRAELLMLAADRAQHIRQVVDPALRAGRDVVSDRSVFSQFAYQGFGRGLSMTDLHEVNMFALDGTWPEMVVFIDIPDEVRVERLRARGMPLDRFELAGDGFFDRVQNGFRSMAARGGRWVTIDGSADMDAVEAQVAAAVDEFFTARAHLLAS